MNDVQIAKMPWWMFWPWFAMKVVADKRPVVMTAGRRARLEDAERMVEFLHEDMLRERAAAVDAIVLATPKADPPI